MYGVQRQASIVFVHHLKMALKEIVKTFKIDLCENVIRSLISLQISASLIGDAKKICTHLIKRRESPL